MCVFVMYVCVCVSVCLSVRLSIARRISETSEAIAIKFDMVTASVTRMHHVLMVLTLSFIQGHTKLKCENNTFLMFHYFRNYSSNAHQVCCEDSLTKDLKNLCQSADLDIHSRSQQCLKIDMFLLVV